MILNLKEIQDISTKILSAVDSNSLSTITDLIELYTEDNHLNMCVTNGDYYTKVKLNIGQPEEFHATVNANLFLKLIPQLTTETLELLIEDNALVIIGNGTYKLPLIFVDDKLLELPKIEIVNKTASFSIDASTLHSIMTYNSKELLKDSIKKPVQKLYYLDEHGCITFTNGACVNNFELTRPIKVLLSNKIVKLFKLFNSEQVNFSLGYDAISDELVQTKVQFSNDDVDVTAILSCDDAMINSVPVSAIRDRAQNTYSYNVIFNKNELLSTINRLLMFTMNSIENKPYSMFTFNQLGVTISNSKTEYSEKVNYFEALKLDIEYKTMLDLKDIKLVLESCVEPFINFSFGDNQAIVFSRGNIYNIIPEIQYN